MKFKSSKLIQQDNQAPLSNKTIQKIMAWLPCMNCTKIRVSSQILCHSIGLYPFLDLLPIWNHLKSKRFSLSKSSNALTIATKTNKSKSKPSLATLRSVSAFKATCSSTKRVLTISMKRSLKLRLTTILLSRHRALWFRIWRNSTQLPKWMSLQSPLRIVKIRSQIRNS